MIGVGTVTYHRPESHAAHTASLHKHLSGIVDRFVTVRDVAPVAKAKNQALRALLDAGCSTLFVGEDDVQVTSPLAVLRYLEAMTESGWQHLFWHVGHGENAEPTEIDGAVTYWPAYHAGWACWTRESLEVGGLMDEGLVNCYEHVEHSLRLAEHGYTSKWRLAADATGSERWLAEIPDAGSVIRDDPDWQSQRIEAKEYWRRAHPESFREVWGG